MQKSRMFELLLSAIHMWYILKPSSLSIQSIASTYNQFSIAPRKVISIVLDSFKVQKKQFFIWVQSIFILNTVLLKNHSTHREFVLLLLSGLFRWEWIKKLRVRVLYCWDSLSRESRRDEIKTIVGNMGKVIVVIIISTVVMTRKECICSFCRFTC